MKKFKHSGATGDLIYSLALVKHFGGGEFYLHLNQMNWIGQYYYGSKPAPFHQDRLNDQDFEFMKEFLSTLPYITSLGVLDQNTEITHNLDRFRPLFVGHPGNYVDIYSTAFGIEDPGLKDSIRNTPWLTVPEVNPQTQGKIIINRTERWLPTTPDPIWAEWKHKGMEKDAVFVGLPQEYEKFKKDLGWDNIPYVETKNMLELAQVIAGTKMFIGNQSQALALAIGLGVPYCCEARRDLPLDRNECYFSGRAQGKYF